MEDTVQENIFGFDIDKKMRNDIAYIENELLSKQIDGNYCKFSRPLQAVAIIGLTEKQHIEYWMKQYKDYPEQWTMVLQAIYNKLSEGLVPREKMMQMIADSKDVDSEKEKAIKALGGRYVRD